MSLPRTASRCVSRGLQGSGTVRATADHPSRGDRASGGGAAGHLPRLALSRDTAARPRAAVPRLRGEFNPDCWMVVARTTLNRDCQEENANHALIPAARVGSAAGLNPPI